MDDGAERGGGGAHPRWTRAILCTDEIEEITEDHHGGTEAQRRN
jgi:hypothetical protein